MRHFFLIILFIFSALLHGRVYAGNGDDLKINQIQILASHNSYHLKTDPAVFRFLNFVYSLNVMPAEMNPQYIDYVKDPLYEQLEKYHLRGLELDVWNDPEGGQFYRRLGNSFVWKKTASKIEALKQPGFKIIHIPDVDYNTTVFTFKEALQQIKQWSEAHPNHLPLFINVEVKTLTPGDKITALKKLTNSIPFDATAADKLDAEVKSIFGENLKGIITPDQVRGSYPTLEQAVLAGNWPRLAEARGKIILIIDGNGNSSEIYKAGHPSLKGRAMFIYAQPNTPETAFVVFNDPIKDSAQIKQLVMQGYILRTRSDESTLQARSGSYTQMNAALASGAQIISTDYYRPDTRAGKHGWTNYHVQLPDHAIGRVNFISKEGGAYNIEE